MAKHSLAAGLLLLALSGAVLALDRPASRSLLRDTRATSGVAMRQLAVRGALQAAEPEADILASPGTAAPVAVAGPLGRRDARDVLSRLVGSLPSGLSLRETGAEARTPWRRTFEIRKGDRRVFPGILTFGSGREGFLLSGDFVPDARVRPGGRLDAGAAWTRAIAHLGAREAKAWVPAQPVLYDSRRGLVPAWLLHVFSKSPPGNYVVVVDGSTGDILHCDDHAAGIDGTASVYRSHPLSCPITIEPIGNIARHGRLEGAFVTVENDDMMAATSGKNEFVYPASNKHLDEANVYYHLDRIHAFFKDRMGFDGLDQPLPVAVYYGEDYDNAMFVPWGPHIVFGDGGRYNVLSRDASVAYHEYTHGVTYKIAQIGSIGAAGAISEGTSDYFAATLLDDPRIAPWVVAKIGKPYLRTCDNRKHFPEDIVNESHQDSLIWSGALWDLRKVLGAEVVDALAYRTCFFINSEATMPVGARAVLLADEQLFGGVHKTEIARVFAARGLPTSDPAARRERRRGALFDSTWSSERSLGGQADDLR